MNLQQLKSVSIIEIASRLGFNLKANKNNACFRGHGNKTPCLRVYEQTNSFFCFSCNAAGNNIDFVKQVLNVDSATAIKWIKKEFFEESKDITSIAKERAPKNTLQDGKKYASIYKSFIDMLSQEEALQYCRGRGLTADIVLKSNIRVIPKGFDYTALIKSFSIDALLASGLFAISKFRKPYPVFFTHRLIIPFFHYDRKTIINLQARNLDTKDEPRYKFLSGIKASIYNLPALIDAEQARDGRVYLTEGVFDCLSCYKLNLLHPIAIPGATNKAIFEPEVFNRLGKLKIIIATDKDHAGQAFFREFLKRYKDSFYKLPKFIDWNIEAKDINEVLTKDINEVSTRRL